MDLQESSLQAHRNRRVAERVPILVPASLDSRNHRYNAKLLNICGEGAMFESRALLAESSRVVVRCGTVVVKAVIVWRKGDRVGVSFETPLAHAQITEQLLRSKALANRLSLYHLSVIDGD